MDTKKYGSVFGFGIMSMDPKHLYEISLWYKFDMDTKTIKDEKEEDDDDYRKK